MEEEVFPIIASIIISMIISIIIAEAQSSDDKRKVSNHRMMRGEVLMNGDWRMVHPSGTVGRY